ncbi:hypothetical protein Pla86_10820 [Planctomycetes bacterium Pla86]|uniref:Uncharacterized protein n=2 Tax=Engelhardtia mirabilis TaxID=2528011 RepID=A0A518BGD2_9BACT|nr:hypothetical protein Pla133_10820 [Planctomycetes bacterium Pla133]QDV00343.1 hypothetical protein Pla86_10820 [Planctomycetes bacterium Pla86]
MNADDGIEEIEYDDGLDALAQVQESPRTATVGAVAALGVLVLGVGVASGWAIVAGEPPLDDYARQASSLGLSPGLLMVGGTLLTALGAVGSTVLRAVRRSVDLLEMAPDHSHALDCLDDSQQRLHVSLVSTEQSVQRTVREALAPLVERIDNLELALAAASDAISQEDGANDAIWRLAASMDQVRAQLDSRLAQQLESFEEHIAKELSRATDEHVATLEERLRSSENRMVAEVEAAAARSAGGIGRGPSAPMVEQAPPARPVVEAAPVAEPPVAQVQVDEAPAAPRQALPASPAAAPIEDLSLGLLAEIDDDGQPRAHPADLYAEPPPPISVDSVPSIRPRRSEHSLEDERTLGQ